MKNRNRSSKPLIFAVLAAIVIGGGVFLMTKQVPAPTAPIEKQLDAKALLEAPAVR